jgi:hypothetical protein
MYLEEKSHKTRNPPPAEATWINKGLLEASECFSCENMIDHISGEFILKILCRDPCHKNVKSNIETADDDLEKRSFKNMVRFYKDKLLQLLSGVRAKKIFKNSECKYLRQHGILDYVDNSWILTKKAKATLLMQI